MIRNLIYFALIIFAISGCKKEIKINIPDNERKILVNGVFNVGDPIVLWLSKSKSMLEKSDIESIDNAEIKLFENDNYSSNFETKIQFWYEKYTWNQYFSSSDSLFRTVYYSKDINVSEDKTYRIEVTAPGIDKMAYVEFKAPTMVPILKIDTSSIKTDQWTYYRQFDLLMNDPSNEENFYIIQVNNISISTYVDEFGEIQTIINSYFENIETDDIFISADNVYLDRGLIFNDKLFDGKQQHIKFKTYKNPMDPYILGNATKYHVILRSISKDYYEYLVSLSLYQEADGNPIAEPVGVKSNVKDGFGIVTAVNQWIDSSIVIIGQENPDSQYYKRKKK